MDTSKLCQKRDICAIALCHPDFIFYAESLWYTTGKVDNGPATQRHRRGEFNVRLAGTSLFLFVLWLLMSGIFKPLIMGFGVVSVVLVMVVTRRMDAVDGSRVNLGLKLVQFVGYIIWLLIEIAKSNWAVTKVILSRDLATRQHLFLVPYSQKTDVGQVIFANSITLTPGTISVEVEDGNILVHAVRYHESDMDALADMDARVSAVERASETGQVR